MLDLSDNADYIFMRIEGELEDGTDKTYYDFDEAEYDAERDVVTLSSTGFKYYYKKEGEVYECLISMDSGKCIDINRYSEGQNEGNPNDQDDSLEIRGFVEALLESYSGDEDEVLYIMPWAEKYLIEIKKEADLNKISRLNFSVDLNYIQKIFMEKEVKNITELITLLDSIFKKVASSIDTLDELYTVVQKTKHTDNIDKCKTKVKANIKDEFSYIEKRKGYDFNDSDQLYNLMVEDREMIEINDDVEDDGKILIFKNIEVNAEITTLNSELLDSTRWWDWLTIEAREEETNKYRTYEHGEVVNEESNF